MSPDAITLADYWMGRDATYALQLDTQTRRNADVTVALANKLLAEAKAAGVPLRVNAAGTLVNSGWRPPAVNAATAGASPTSRHMTAQAVDLFDPDEKIDQWLMATPQVLRSIGLWMEHPSATPRWCHVQTVPPHSGNRVFMP